MSAYRILFCSLATLLLAGCGGGSSTPKAPKTIQSPPIPANLNSRPDPQPAPANVAQTVNKEPAAGTKSSSKLKSTGNLFEDEDPRNVFEITGEEPVAQVGSAQEAWQVDRFAVGDLAPETDSTFFEVGAAGGNAPETAATGPSRNESFQLPSGFSEVPSYGYSEDGLPLRIRGEKSGALMALVPGGLAHVGSQNGPDETQPAFTPFLDTFYMDVTEVTLEQYQRFRDEIKQKKNMKAQAAQNDGQDPELPALGLPWGVAQGFAHWAGKELPTEAEFEKAARGPDGWRTPWGNGRAVFAKARPYDLIVPVASFQNDCSVYGIFDLAGNAREWCFDLYSDTAHQDATAAKDKTLRNWSGPKKGASSNIRVVKGNGPEWSAWHREGRSGGERHPDIGFRGVLRVKTPAADSKGD